MALSILNSSGASPGATEKVAALVARATCNGASHSSALQYIKHIAIYETHHNTSDTGGNHAIREDKHNNKNNSRLRFLSDYDLMELS